MVCEVSGVIKRWLPSTTVPSAESQEGPALTVTVSGEGVEVIGKSKIEVDNLEGSGSSGAFDGVLRGTPIARGQVSFVVKASRDTVVTMAVSGERAGTASPIPLS